MSAAGRCVLTHLLRCSLAPGQYNLAIVRSLSLTPHLSSKPSGSPGSSDNEESLSQPIRFSTSKASHRTWRVEGSMGSRFQRPWWKVLPLSVLAVGFLLWCFFRKESVMDHALEKQLFEHLPSLFSNEEELKKEPDDDSKGN